MTTPIDTTPNYPDQPEILIEAAAHDLPGILQDMDNEKRFEAPEPGHGHRVVLASDLPLTAGTFAGSRVSSRNRESGQNDCRSSGVFR